MTIEVVNDRPAVNSTYANLSPVSGATHQLSGTVGTFTIPIATNDEIMLTVEGQFSGLSLFWYGGTTPATSTLDVSSNNFEFLDLHVKNKVAKVYVNRSLVFGRSLSADGSYQTLHNIQLTGVTSMKSYILQKGVNTPLGVYEIEETTTFSNQTLLVSQEPTIPSYALEDDEIARVFNFYASTTKPGKKVIAEHEFTQKPGTNLYTIPLEVAGG